MQKSTFCPDSLKMQSASWMNWCKRARGTWTTNLQLTICKCYWLCATRLYLLRIWPPCISFWTKVQPATMEVSGDFVPETALEPRKPLRQRLACYTYRQSELDARLDRLGESPGRYQLLALSDWKLVNWTPEKLQGIHAGKALASCRYFDCTILLALWLHWLHTSPMSTNLWRYVQVCRMIRFVSQSLSRLVQAQGLSARSMMVSFVSGLLTGPRQGFSS